MKKKVISGAAKNRAKRATESARPLATVARAVDSHRKRREARIAELRERCQVLSNERVELEEINEAEDAAPWIGRCFKYRNRDSDGIERWMYLRVLKHDGGNSFVMLKCDAQPHGWRIAVDSEHNYLLPDPKGRGYVEITRREFNQQWAKFARGIEAMNEQ